MKVCAPVPGTCPVCATKHEATAPHDRDSVYYQAKFRRQHKRLPSWEDAMGHCSETVKLLWRKKLAKRGIPTDRAPEDVTALGE